MWSQELNNRILIREILVSELQVIQSHHFARIFANRVDENSSGSFQHNHSPQWVLRVGLFENDQVVGWHVGYSVDGETYYMQNSAILEEYRGQGLYSLFLESLLGRIQQQGLQVVMSLHHPNNAAVLIPKIKKGFIISGVQFHERFRFLVELKYFFDSSRRRAFGTSMGLEL